MKNLQGIMINPSARFSRFAALTCAAMVFSSSAFGSTVYNNADNLLNRSFAPSNNAQFGDQVFLSGSDRRITDFQFDYFVSTNSSGNETAELFFYQNNGGGAALTPGTQLYSSGEIALGTGFQTALIQALSVTVPSTFTWAVQFGGVDLGEQIGLLLADPPTVGSSLDDFWVRNTDGTWSTFLIPDGTPANFAARIIAVPEPTTYALVTIAGLAFFGARRLRKR